MKTCPVCEAVAFDDAAKCFGCLHEFTGDEPTFAEPKQEERRQQPSMRVDAMPEFLIRFTPLADPSGAVTWSCAVEQPVAG